MVPLSIFIGSSSEGLPVAKELRHLLQAELDSTGIVELWKEKFPVGETAIESLEKAADEADAALILMTPDDIKVTRNRKVAVPRDNLIFELGLFTGAIGRERSMIVRGGAQELKLPTDLLGINAFVYDSGSDQERTISLRVRCVELTMRIKKLGVRPKWSTEGRRSLEANAQFIRETEGYWWEKINSSDGCVLSFFSIMADPLTGGVRLEGSSYGVNGKHSADWKSEMARLFPNDRRLTYLWVGKHPLPECPHRPMNGYGSLDFSVPEGAPSRFMSGSGDFWDVDETIPSKTAFKPVEIRRASEGRQAGIMTSGSEAERQILVAKIIREW